MSLLSRQPLIPSLHRQGTERFEKLFPDLHVAVLTKGSLDHLHTISCFKFHSHREQPLLSHVSQNSVKRNSHALDSKQEKTIP